MYQRLILIFIVIFVFSNCAKKEKVSIKPPNEEEAYKIYEEALNAMNIGEFYFAAEKFAEAEKILPEIEASAKASLMSGFCYYSINFYDEALVKLESFVKRYPADKNVAYAKYLMTISYYEQILGEEKDIGPLLKSKSMIQNYLNEYPNTDYSLDLKFKLGLIRNQLAAKEMYIAKYYIKTQKWIPAINRLNNIVNNYDDTIFIEEALHRLVEINYNLGLLEESKKIAKILGYNYNSSEWYENSYSLINKDYKIEQKKLKKASKDQETSLVKKMINRILNK